MSTAPNASGSGSEFRLADLLRRQLEEFVLTGPLKETFEEHRSLYFKEFEEPDELDSEGVLDWFLFDWFDDSGEGALSHFISAKPDLTSQERDVLLEWQDSLNSAFQIRSVSRNELRLRDLESGYDLDVTLTKPESHSLFKKGEYVVARLLPLGDHIILSGLQFVLPDKKTALAWLELRDRVDELHSPEEIEKAIRESCDAFCALFGCDEVTVPSSKLLPTLKRFQEYLLKERRDPETGSTPAERFREQLGRELEMTDVSVPPQMFAAAQDVTILCDDFDGIVLLPDFSRFKRVFSTDDPDKTVPEWKELIWTYIKNPDLPTVAFERVAEQQPKRVEKVLRAVLNDNDFSIEHLYALLLHYKEPVEGLDDLEDDRQLWDLFNGNRKPPKAAKGRSPRSKNTGTKAPGARKLSSEGRTMAGKSSADSTVIRWSKVKPKSAASSRDKQAKPAEPRKAVAKRPAKPVAKSGSRGRR
jgi:hypothetical protein